MLSFNIDLRNSDYYDLYKGGYAFKGPECYLRIYCLTLYVNL